MIRCTQIPSGQHRGQIVTLCDHVDCAGRVVSVDVMPYLAQLAATQHLTTHEGTS